MICSRICFRIWMAIFNMNGNKWKKSYSCWIWWLWMKVFDSWRIRWIWMEADDSSQIVDLWECWGRADPLLGDVTTIRSWLGDTNADAMQLNTPTTTVQRDTNNSLDQYCAEGYQRYYLASLLCWIPIPVPAIQHLAWLGDTNADAIMNTSTIFYQQF